MAIKLSDIKPGWYHVFWKKPTMGFVQMNPLTKALEVLIFQKRYFLEDFRGEFRAPAESLEQVEARYSCDDECEQQDNEDVQENIDDETQEIQP